MAKSLSKMAIAALVAECKEANLSASGTAKQLRERLLASRASKDKEALEMFAASQQLSVRVGSTTVERKALATSGLGFGTHRSRPGEANLGSRQRLWVGPGPGQRWWIVQLVSFGENKSESEITSV